MFETLPVEGPRHFEPDHCANCLTPLPPTNLSLFCAERCQQTADLVRYWRRITRDGRIRRPDIQQALQMRVAHFLAGGYHKKARSLPKAIEAEVRARDNDRCRKCGKPGEEIDHIEGDSSELTNLQLLCLTCHLAKTRQRMRPITPEQRQVVAKLERERVRPDEPVLLADDEVGWKTEWSRLKKERREALHDDFADMGYERSDYPDLSWEELVDLVLDDYEPIDGPEDTGFGPGSYFAHAMAKDD